MIGGHVFGNERWSVAGWSNTPVWMVPTGYTRAAQDEESLIRCRRRKGVGGGRNKCCGRENPIVKQGNVLCDFIFTGIRTD